MAFKVPPQRRRGADLASSISHAPAMLNSAEVEQGVDGSQQWIIFNGPSDEMTQSPALNTEPLSEQSTVHGGLLAIASGTESWTRFSDDLFSFAAPDDSAELDLHGDDAHPGRATHADEHDTELELRLESGPPDRDLLQQTPALARGDRSDESPRTGYSEALMPAHDGLGSFAPSSIPVQRQIYSFERFNPRRAVRTPVTAASLQRQEQHVVDRAVLLAEQTPVEVDLLAGMDLHRRKRIEQWTIESSRIVLEEVARESRRRQLSVSGLAAAGDRPRGGISLQRASSVAVSSIVEQRSFWDNLHTRIQDFFGLDNEVLAAIFGEALISRSTEKEGLAGEESEVRAHHRIETELQRLLDEPTAEGDAGTVDDPDVRWMKLCDRVDHEMSILARHLRGIPKRASEQPSQPLSSDTLPTTQLQIVPLPPARHLSFTDTTLQRSPAAYEYSEQPQSAYLDEDPDVSNLYEQQQRQQQDAIDESHWSARLGFRSTFEYLRQHLSSSLPSILPSLSSSPVESLDDGPEAEGVRTPVGRRARLGDAKMGEEAEVEFDGWSTTEG